ncbi:MAG TPA: hypothetical protein VIB49_07640 [Thermoplasmata archaeon]|jgi:hypothetical protein
MRSRRAKIAAALTALAFLPLAVIASTPVRGSSPTTEASRDLSGLPFHASAGLDAPTVDAIRRGWLSGLFGSFRWDGFAAQGAFAQFSFNTATGEIVSYLARRGSESLAIVESIELVPAVAFDHVVADGPVFKATSDAVMVSAHDEPSALLGIRSGAGSRRVVFHFIDSLTNVTAQSMSTIWPQAELAFSVGETHGRLLLGTGSFNVSGAVVVANLDPNDLLAMRIVPAFAEEKAARTAVLDSFASGRLAAEFALVAKSGGGWVETSARFRNGLVTNSASVAEGSATVQLGSIADRDGLLLLAFDPKTMPADATHRLLVTLNDAEIPEVEDTTETFYAIAGSQEHAYYTRLAMNATVLAVYLPNLQSSTVQVRSLETPSPPSDVIGVEIAAAAALGVVSIAAGVMFRRRET